MIRGKIDKALQATIFLAIVLLCTSCSREYGDTDEYRSFLKARRNLTAINRYEVAQGYTYSLANGVLTFSDASENEIWKSDKYWFVDDFRLFDVDGDGDLDCLFTLWKSYSFAREFVKENVDASVKQHLFLYTIRVGRGKALWGSSNLPRQIYSFVITEGTPNPVSTGAVLTTSEGEYQDDFSEVISQQCVYTWQGWGFVPEE